MSRKLEVYVGKKLAGILSEHNDIWAFQYVSDWLSDPDCHFLTPNIPLSPEEQVDGSSVRHIQWFFDNLLPEEKAREILARDIGEPIGDAFALLARAGRESAGAITLLPPGMTMPNDSVHLLSDQEISERIRSLPKTPMNRGEHKRMSLAGAQHKMLVVMHDNQLYEPSGQVPSTHILKPEHSDPDYYKHTPRNEWFCMKLAGMCGLNVPEVDIQYFPEPAYLVKRFDRKGEYPNQTRIHTLDGCQLLGIPHIFKYTSSNVGNLLRLADGTRIVGQTRLKLFVWAIFNLFIGNGDAHLKNVSFFIQKSVTSLTPHYDLLSTAIYGEPGAHVNHELSQPMGKARYLGDVTLDDVIKFAAGLGLPERLAKITIERMIKDIVPASESLIEYIESLPPYPSKGGELRVVREIHHKCILEMVRRLKVRVGE